ncbi:hypothetical protein [Streptomyces sp. enrichment culture]
MAAVTAGTVRADGEKKWFMVDSLVDGATPVRVEAPITGHGATRTDVRAG